MEERFNRVKKVTDALEEALDNYVEVQNDIRLLDRYEYKGLWLRDFEADEKGQIPKDMARGILSEDGLYDLLIKIKLLNNRMYENFSRIRSPSPVTKQPRKCYKNAVLTL